MADSNDGEACGYLQAMVAALLSSRASLTEEQANAPIIELSYDKDKALHKITLDTVQNNAALLLGLLKAHGRARSPGTKVLRKVCEEADKRCRFGLTGASSSIGSKNMCAEEAEKIQMLWAYCHAQFVRSPVTSRCVSLMRIKMLMEQMEGQPGTASKDSLAILDRSRSPTPSSLRTPRSIVPRRSRSPPSPCSPPPRSPSQSPSRSLSPPISVRSAATCDGSAAELAWAEELQRKYGFPDQYKPEELDALVQTVQEAKGCIDMAEHRRSVAEPRVRYRTKTKVEHDEPSTHGRPKAKAARKRTMAGGGTLAMNGDFKICKSFQRGNWIYQIKQDKHALVGIQSNQIAADNIEACMRILLEQASGHTALELQEMKKGMVGAYKAGKLDEILRQLGAA